MRVAILYQGEFQSYERIEKIAKTLAAAGHHPYLLCNAYSGHYRREEKAGDLTVSRIGPAIANETASRILKFPVFLNPLWLAQIVRFVRRFEIDVITVIDVPLAPAAWLVARAFRIPVVMDMWENYPEALKGWAKHNWKTRWFKNPALARAVERWIVPRMDHTVVVVEEQRDRLIAEGIEPERISVVTNAVDVDLFNTPVSDLATPLDDDAGSYKLIYVGILTIERGLENIINALPLLRQRIPGIRFYIAGSGSHEQQIRQQISRQGVEDLVRLVGWIPFNQIQHYLERADLCVVPHLNNAFINTTIPNKLFQYMLMGKPVLVSDAAPLARIIRESGCGYVFQSGNPQSAADAIEAANAARNDRSVGERGRAFVQEKYTWDKVAPALRQVYERLPPSGKSRG